MLINDPHLHQSPLQWALFDSSMQWRSYAADFSVFHPLASQWMKQQAARNDSLAPVVEALDAGFTPQEAIDATLGERLAAKLGGWKKSAPSARSGAKPR